MTYSLVVNLKRQPTDLSFFSGSSPTPRSWTVVTHSTVRCGSSKPSRPIMHPPSASNVRYPARIGEVLPGFEHACSGRESWRELTGSHRRDPTMLVRARRGLFQHWAWHAHDSRGIQPATDNLLASLSPPLLMQISIPTSKCDLPPATGTKASHVTPWPSFKFQASSWTFARSLTESRLARSIHPVGPCHKGEVLQKRHARSR